jgi:ATP-dependent DNA helicase RecG
MLNLLDPFYNWENSASDTSLEDVNAEVLKKNINKVYYKSRISKDFKSVELSLNELGLLNGKFLTNAGKILFSNKAPILVKMGIYSSEDKSVMIDSIQVSGNIFECIEKTMDYISNNISWRAQFGEIKRIDIPKIPINGLREIVVNSFMHASYLNSELFHEIEIFPNSVVISNPGRLLPGMRLDLFEKENTFPMFRNMKISQIFYMVDVTDTLGLGLKRAFSEFNENEVKFEYFNSDRGFSFKIYRYGYCPNLYSVNHKLNHTEKAILYIIQEYPSISLSEIAVIICKSEKTTYNNILILEKMSCIKRLGKKIDCCWEII